MLVITVVPFFFIVGHKFDMNFPDKFETENYSGIENLQNKLSMISNKLKVISDSCNVYIGYGFRIYEGFGVAENECDPFEFVNLMALLNYHFNIDGSPRLYTGFIYD